MHLIIIMTLYYSCQYINLALTIQTRETRNEHTAKNDVRENLGLAFCSPGRRPGTVVIR